MASWQSRWQNLTEGQFQQRAPTKTKVGRDGRTKLQLRHTVVLPCLAIQRAGWEAGMSPSSCPRMVRNKNKLQPCSAGSCYNLGSCSVQ